MTRMAELEDLSPGWVTGCSQGRIWRVNLVSSRVTGYLIKYLLVLTQENSLQIARFLTRTVGDREETRMQRLIGNENLNTAAYMNELLAGNNCCLLIPNHVLHSKCIHHTFKFVLSLLQCCKVIWLSPFHRWEAEALRSDITCPKSPSY